MVTKDAGGRGLCSILWVWVLSSAGFALSSPGAEPASSEAALQKEFSGVVRPLMERLCLGCHSTEKQRGDLDLERFSSAGEVLRHPKVWQAVVEQVTLREMPPREKPQPAPGEREQLLKWVDAALDEAARARAGDPGPVVLRRLDNAEYTYTIRDLAGVPSLRPADELPADSAAGEGFMNTGNSLVMSPALLTKYFDAGKAIASHAVLLPDSIRFSPSTTRRDWTEEVLADIRGLYRQYADSSGADQVNLQGIIFDTNEGGRLPIEKYLKATLDLRAADGVEGQAAERIEKLAAERSLSAKYVKSLWSMLHSTEPSLLLDEIRARWRDSKPEDAGRLTAEVARWQKALWKLSSVGHIGKVGGPTGWLEPVSPLAAAQEVRFKLGAPQEGNVVTVYLIAGDAGDGNANDFVIWEKPRLVVPGHPDLLLRDARGFIREMTSRRDVIFRSTSKCLAAAVEASAPGSEITRGELAKRHEVDPASLDAWLDYLGIGSTANIELERFTQQIQKSAGYDFVNGWGTNDTPNLVANSSDQSVRIPGNMKAHGVTMHPSPQRLVAAGWQCPLACTVKIEAKVTHAHPECGNGVEWFLELRRGKTRQRLSQGVAHGPKEVATGPFEGFSVLPGDLISLLIGPRDGNHSCDLTDVELVIRSSGDSPREWSLTRDVSPDVTAGNPHADRLGNAGVWHFYTEAISGKTTGPTIPAGSLLARWQSAGNPAEKQALAVELEQLLASDRPAPKDSPDAQLKSQLASLGGPLFAGAAARGVTSAESPKSGESWSLDPAAFGKHPNGTPIDAESLCVQAPSVVEIRLPADLVTGAELVTRGFLHDGTGGEGSVQIQASATRPERPSTPLAGEPTVSNANGPWTSNNRQVTNGTPILAKEGSEARRRIEAGFEAFRQWFPATLCYVKIVPVDEAVTLTLFYREDHHLVRLMLDDAQAARLGRLWDELHFISLDALTLVDAFEQLWQYATQDADPKVFEPMRKPINDRAAAFRKRLVDTEPRHVDALVQLAAAAYRRPLEEREAQEIRDLYRKLRAEEIPHDEAIRLALARILVAPSFLYRLEKALPGTESSPVSDWELASRLSYFLWSSAPDAELRQAAASGKLREPEALVRQARRMLYDPRIRRLATEFGCAWLHIHGFDELDEKSERVFPTFASLRGDLYEEAIRFFTDAFQRDASVLELFDSDHTFLNETLARHYGVEGVTGPDWRRVDGVRQKGRGGLLGFGATLAKQSGASRTSPILRGNWVSEVLLGDKLPRPPKDVPRLPEDEAAESLTQRQLVEKHSSDPRCSGCHARIDGFGFALEGFDAIGRARDKDLGGRPIETRSTLPDGAVVEGAIGLREHLLSKKRHALLWQLSRKLLGYALGRGVILSDKPLLEEMQRNLKDHDYHFSAAVETIVRSKQFLEIRGRDAAPED